MTLLVVNGRAHYQRNDLVKESVCSKLPSFFCDLLERCLSNWGSAILHFEEKNHDLSVSNLFFTHVLLGLLHQISEFIFLTLFEKIGIVRD
jgi:hypothetical protein